MGEQLPEQRKRSTRDTYKYTVLLDLGEVLATPTGLIETLSARVAHDPAAFHAAYWRRRLEYDLGLDAEEYWTDVLEGLGIPLVGSVVHDLIRIDTRAWTTLRPDAILLLQKLYRAEARVGILSNSTAEMAQAARDSPWSRWISDWFFSNEIGLAKPDVSIFRYVGASLGVAPEAILYLDDSLASTTSARAAGWDAHLWTSPPQAYALLTELGVLQHGGT